MTCLSCHVMHPPEHEDRSRSEWADDQLQAGDGSASCLQCHPDFREQGVAHSGTIDPTRYDYHLKRRNRRSVSLLE